jgi:hypothetical protein
MDPHEVLTVRLAHGHGSEELLHSDRVRIGLVQPQ